MQTWEEGSGDKEKTRMQNRRDSTAVVGASASKPEEDALEIFVLRPEAWSSFRNENVWNNVFATGRALVPACGAAENPSDPPPEPSDCEKGIERASCGYFPRVSEMSV